MQEKPEELSPTVYRVCLVEKGKAPQKLEENSEKLGQDIQIERVARVDVPGRW